MLHLINDIEEIKPILRLLYTKLEKDSGKPYEVHYQGQNGITVDIMISINNDGFWWGQKMMTDQQKFLILYGKDAPEPGSYVKNPFEFSFSTVKHNGRFSGQFGKDDTGTYLLHKGHFSGRTMTEFDMLCNEKKIARTPVKKRGHPGYYVIGKIDDKNISRTISQFVDTVAEFKKKM
jgi:hypothetical protein